MQSASCCCRSCSKGCELCGQARALVQLIGGAARVLHDQLGVQVVRLGRAAQQERPHLRGGLLPRLFWHAPTQAGRHPRTSFTVIRQTPMLGPEEQDILG